MWYPELSEKENKQVICEVCPVSTPVILVGNCWISILKWRKSTQKRWTMNIIDHLKSQQLTSIMVHYMDGLINQDSPLESVWHCWLNPFQGGVGKGIKIEYDREIKTELWVPTGVKEEMTEVKEEKAEEVNGGFTSSLNPNISSSWHWSWMAQTGAGGLKHPPENLYDLKKVCCKFIFGFCPWATLYFWPT